MNNEIKDYENFINQVRKVGTGDKAPQIVIRDPNGIHEQQLAIYHFRMNQLARYHEQEEKDKKEKIENIIRKRSQQTLEDKDSVAINMFDQLDTKKYKELQIHKDIEADYFNMLD